MFIVTLLSVFWLFYYVVCFDVIPVNFTFVYLFLPMDSENDLCLTLFTWLTYVNLLHWMGGLYYYGFLVNCGIGLILEIQTFYPYFLSVLYIIHGWAGCVLRSVLSLLTLLLCLMSAIGSPWGCVQPFTPPHTHRNGYLVVPSGGHAGDHWFAVSENVELCDMMCVTVSFAELSCQQRTLQFSMIWGTDVA